VGERNVITVAVEKQGTLYFLLNAAIGAVNKGIDVWQRSYDRRTLETSAGLKAIALALSTPQDNSAQVQAEIDKLTAQLNAGTAEVQDAINQHKKGE